MTFPSEQHSVSPDTVPVRLLGGPDDCHGKTLTAYTREDLSKPRHDLGVCLPANGTSDGRSDSGAGAFFSPDDSPAPVDVWFYRCLFPFDLAEPVPLLADRHQELSDLATDADGVPARWTIPDQSEAKTQRLLLHWEAGNVPKTRPAVWVVRAVATGVKWELLHHADGQWVGALVPEKA
jgi:hypothetical protein